MTQLQNEILKLLDESNLNENKEKLEEVSFNEISTAVTDINPEAFKGQIGIFTASCERILKTISTAMSQIQDVEKTYAANKDLRNRGSNKEKMVNTLKSASDKINSLKDEVDRAKTAYNAIRNEFNKLYGTISNVKTYIDKKTSWFGRMFGFWK